MIKTINKKEQTQKRHQRVRIKIQGTSDCPRLAVYRSLKHIYAQIIDDTKGVTLVASSTKAKDLAEKLAH
ncbi:MAG: 50S ribosomal protein L18, partial [bacterium]|nr:50S ribosomal protein L18 [bacterium]